MSMLSNLTRTKGDPEVLTTGPSSLSWPDRLGRNLGWFGIGLGVIGVLAGRRSARALGLYGMGHVMRAIGAREIASGIVTLSTERKAGLWMRVAGDAMDLAILSRALHPWNPRRRTAKLAMMAVAGISLLDLAAAVAVTRQGQRRSIGTRSYTDRGGFPKGLEAAQRAAEHRNGEFKSSSTAAARAI